MTSDDTRRELFRLWAEIDAVQRALGEKIPPTVRTLTMEARRIMGLPELKLVQAAVLPDVRLLCPECAGETRLVRDDPLQSPYLYCPDCEWRGRVDPRKTVGRLGVARP